MEFVFEPAEGSLALDSPCQPAAGALIGDSVGEVGHVLVPDPGRQRLDDDQVQFIEVDWGLPVDTGVSGPERDLSRVRVDQPVVFVIGLVGQRVGDLFKIEAAQVKHQARIDLPRYLRSSTGTPDQRQMRNLAARTGTGALGLARVGSRLRDSATSISGSSRTEVTGSSIARSAAEADSSNWHNQPMIQKPSSRQVQWREWSSGLTLTKAGVSSMLLRCRAAVSSTSPISRCLDTGSSTRASKCVSPSNGRLPAGRLSLPCPGRLARRVTIAALRAWNCLCRPGQLGSLRGCQDGRAEGCARCPGRVLR